MSAPVFISYSSKDQKIAQTLLPGSMEARGQNCWIAGRNVRPGENFQEAIVRALREARVMVLVFTGNANNSEEIKKEVVLAGRHHVTVVPVRVEDVVPSDAFAYEFATRQWIDLFQDWEQQVEQLVAQIDMILGTPADQRIAPLPAPKPKPADPFKAIAIALAVILLVGGGALAIWRPWQEMAMPPPRVAGKIAAPAQQAVAAPAPTPASAPAAEPAAPASKPAKAVVAMPSASSGKIAAERPPAVTAGRIHGRGCAITCNRAGAGCLRS